MINYPIKKTYQKEINTKNRGMNLENDINSTNQYYLDNKIACIYKKPTPIQIVKVDYPRRSLAVITEAYFRTPSTTDYNGVYKGYYLDFDCKETNSLTSFPLRNIHKHQIDHLINVNEQKGIGFLIVSFNRYQEYYLLPFNILKRYLDNNGRKSIPYKVFKEECYKIKESYNPRLDYLKEVDKLIENCFKNH